MTAQPVYVSFSADINVSTAETLIATMANLAGQGAEEVHLLIATSGGSVQSGINLYNVLRGMPFRLITHNVANIDSIGNAVFLAGEPRFSCAHSTFMFHGVTWGTGGATSLPENTLREYLQNVQADQDRISAIIDKHTGLTVDQVKQFFREAATKDATYAVEAGLVDAIKDVEIPSGATTIAHVFQR